MTHGELVGRGAPEELLATDGRYADHWRVQSGEVGDLPDSFLDRVAERTDPTED